MKSNLLIIFVFLFVAVFTGFLSLDFWRAQRSRPDPVVVEIDSPSSFCQSADIQETQWSQESYNRKLGEVLAKYEVSREEWLTNRGNAWTNRWAIIREMNAWQLERMKTN